MVTTNPPYIVGNHGLTGDNQAKMIARHETLCTLEDVISEAAKSVRSQGDGFIWYTGLSGWQKS